MIDTRVSSFPLHLLLYIYILDRYPANPVESSFSDRPAMFRNYRLWWISLLIPNGLFPTLSS
jgi:hypothetical protein